MAAAGGGAPRMRDVERVGRGVALVLSESLETSPTVRSLRRGDIMGALSDALRAIGDTVSAIGGSSVQDFGPSSGGLPPRSAPSAGGGRGGGHGSSPAGQRIAPAAEGTTLGVVRRDPRGGAPVRARREGGEHESTKQKDQGDGTEANDGKLNGTERLMSGATAMRTFEKPVAASAGVSAIVENVPPSSSAGVSAMAEDLPPSSSSSSSSSSSFSVDGVVRDGGKKPSKMSVLPNAAAVEKEERGGRRGWEGVAMAAAERTKRDEEEEENHVLRNDVEMEAKEENVLTSGKRNEAEGQVPPSPSPSPASDLGERLKKEDGVGESRAKVELPASKPKPRERRVPSTPLARVIGFGGLAAGLVFGTLRESARRAWEGVPLRNTPKGGENGTNGGATTSSSPPTYSAVINERNAERLAAALCRNEEKLRLVGKRQRQRERRENERGDGGRGGRIREVLGALERVRQGADIMPKSQLEQVLTSELGLEWRKPLREFTDQPIAAASIGQVHRAVLAENGMEVAMKVQYPGVAESIDSDIENLRRLLMFTNFIPKGLYLDHAVKIAKEELARECDYHLEAANQQRFKELLQGMDGFYRKIMLIDFGAARDYPKPFVDDYLRMVRACADRDRQGVLEYSRRLGFLTGEESEVMLDAHTEASFVVGMPFSETGGFDFRATNLTRRVTALGAVMLNHRLTPPPDEAYSLHRKLSGAFLVCIKLGAVVPCREMFLKVYEDYSFGGDGDGGAKRGEGELAAA
ncbi:hypothetical protein CBR_g37217 [Chara braunii]|uniref:ABC1 atypical kinase-like domain-containing protein n=1 Tax=Chara braunii TaxID=69332 RepID=A0A388LMP7_CHABU|nr:hypothetical protein CBR_g37217 [Chara braunii]|eukprot:GBG83503.1 hypothetical protein CBR_g37217 [Chara braunii]